MVLEESSPSSSRSFVAVSTSPRRAARSRHRAASFSSSPAGPFSRRLRRCLRLPRPRRCPTSATSLASSRTTWRFLKQVVAELFVERGADLLVARGEAQRLDARAGELAVEAERALDLHLPVTEGGVGEDFRLRRFLELQEGVADALDVFGGEFAVLLAHVLAQRANHWVASMSWTLPWRCSGLRLESTQT